MASSAREIISQAAQAGMENAWRLMGYTPAEIEAEFAAMAARRQIEAQQIDLLAYLTGRYAMLGMHAPKRYPKRPNAVLHAPRSMSDAQMKRVFADIAAGRREEHGGS